MIGFSAVVSLMSAAGIGGIVGGVITSFIQVFWSRKNALDERRFREKKEAYAGLFNAIYQVARSPTIENTKEAGYWRSRCELVGSTSVRTEMSALFLLADGTENPSIGQVEANLLQAMRQDLGF